MSEKCDRCGSVGEDRRTLWHACFYAMDELGLPFEQLQIRGRVCEQEGTKELKVIGMTVPTFSKPRGKSDGHNFYTLRVCKRCRGEWMAAIKAWFLAAPQGEDHDADEPAEGCGSGIFVRVNGSLQEITREEWDRRNPGREPARVVREGVQ